VVIIDLDDGVDVIFVAGSTLTEYPILSRPLDVHCHSILPSLLFSESIVAIT